MRPSFFIFSLPRSGTAWLSEFLTSRDSYCFHEPMGDEFPHEWAQSAALRPETHVGGVDTSAYLYATRMMTAIPHAKIFALLRDPSEVQLSVKRLGIDNYDAHRQFEMISRMPCEKIFYENFHDLEYLESLWSRIIGTGFDRQRAEKLIELNIQRDVRRFVANRPGLETHLRKLVQ